MKIEKINKQLAEVLLFLLKLLILAIPLYLILWLKVDLNFLRQLVVEHTKILLSFLNFSIEHEGFSIIIDNLVVLITKDCTGWKSLLFFSSLVIATKSSLKSKVLGLSIGLPSIYVLNLFRITGLSYLALFYGIKSYNVAHDLVWQVFSIGMILGLWSGWMKLRS